MSNWIKSFTIRTDSTVSGATEHESALCYRADLPLGCLSEFRQRISDSRRQLRYTTDFRNCIWVSRRYCPSNNTTLNLNRKERKSYTEVPSCFCGCTYCVD